MKIYNLNLNHHLRPMLTVNLQFRCILGGWRKLLLYVSIAMAAIFEFVSEGGWGG